ncbi:ATP-binding protein [Anaerosporobacter sp.]|uniref:tRNA 2-thiocytidine biosynthesis TtcA family protein n=1 Tax=Anaerosporobacter sp. TaxID=1872529 RepID=UPI00286EDEA8|nr:ATP-binding protein [Anaerosporobacter sp.]
MSRELTTCQLIERSINKKFRKEIWSPFVQAIKKYELIQAGDHIAVCISGGKDSMLLAKLMQILQRITEIPFEITFLMMDPGYNPINRQKIESNAKLLEIPLVIFETDIFDIVNEIDKSPCYLCARMRRGNLYSNAKELGCNKIALGHHMSDVIETTLMGMLYGSQIQGMMPKLHSTNFEGMELIRPMYCILEENIIAWKNYNELEFIQCACRFTENCTSCDNGVSVSKRQEVKELIKKLKKDNKTIETNIFNSIHNVSLDTLISYKQKGVEHSFLDTYYDKRKEE